MDAHTTVAVAQQIDSFQLLDKVNAFYNQAWDMLIIYISIGTGVVGIVVPILLQLAQQRFYRLEEKRIKDELMAEIKKEVEDKFKQEQKQLESNLADVTAMVFHSQAVQYGNQNKFYEATENILISITNYIKGKGGMNLGRALVCLNGYLPFLAAKDIEKLKLNDRDIDKIMEETTEYDKGGYVVDSLRSIKEALEKVRAKV